MQSLRHLIWDKMLLMATCKRSSKEANRTGPISSALTACGSGQSSSLESLPILSSKPLSGKIYREPGVSHMLSVIDMRKIGSNIGL